MTSRPVGRVIAAAENHIAANELRLRRREFIQGGLSAGALMANSGAAAQSTDATLIPPWTRSLGAPVVTTGYGM
ncbi:MAG: hypothetical protein ACXW16_08755, partial [Burkholderiaceae bacterium]